MLNIILVKGDCSKPATVFKPLSTENQILPLTKSDHSVKSLQCLSIQYLLPLSLALLLNTDLERCSLTCINLSFHLRQREKLSIGELSIFQLYVLGLASCCLSWELGIQFVLVTLAATFFTNLDTWVRMICYWFSFSTKLSVCAC